MAKIRVYELAKELGLESREVLERAHALGLELKTASSSLDDEAADLVRLARRGDGACGRRAGDLGPAEEEEQEEAPPAAVPDEETPAEVEPRTVEVPAEVTPALFAERVGVQTGDVVKALLQMGEMVPPPFRYLQRRSISSQSSSSPTREDCRRRATAAGQAPVPVYDDDEASLRPRPPVVTVMGHVDHGKTTLLDTIRKTNVVGGEHGGITQHIGAYQVDVGGRRVTFIDTPGHEAFTALRAWCRGNRHRGPGGRRRRRGDAADRRGDQPHQGGGRPDDRRHQQVRSPTANPTAVRAALTEFGVIAEELGGDVTTVEVSALTGDGVDELIEVLDLTAQLEDLKANPGPRLRASSSSPSSTPAGPGGDGDRPEGHASSGRRNRAGTAAGRVRAMLDDIGDRVKEAEPSNPGAHHGVG